MPSLPSLFSFALGVYDAFPVFQGDLRTFWLQAMSRSLRLSHSRINSPAQDAHRKRLKITGGRELSAPTSPSRTGEPLDPLFPPTSPNQNLKNPDDPPHLPRKPT
ncbi:hypothetical protein K469DRAFT_707774 [Zopfia rhizophila CBS 207.26]|uniref:Uncharacterized protein n=1 Tax=Zopfia rhizophila CBS 207.26 TaxID=1314779 RepID=A0A6A6E4K1_9PEZI|nr:hypothetical protein K469DRAFT_707774 [Zopfia rhizophila CBS 207.26]